ncbi:MAG: biotin--[acetyl-CoA-carboxylase] ligase, partial [Hydrocarboniphaga effusa]|nr:biotin--[acetyl-CoA-carboxylase] ligase [Hydrocarboniphaga effusa]
MARALGASELLPLMQTLSDRRWHSGAHLAATAGITRAGLSKRLHKLMELGLEIETRSGRGCRLSQPLDLLEADTLIGALPPALRARVPVQVRFSTDSTNRQAMDGDAARDPQVLLAEHQSAGRGRHGRSWHSPIGANLYLSLAWTFAQWPPQLSALPLAAGVAVAQALRSCGLTRLKLKWPNDLVVNHRKLGGLLIEQRGETGGSCRVVIGLGVNVHMKSAQGIEQPWTSLSELMGRKTPSRNLLAARIIEYGVAMLDRFALEGFAPFADAWRKLDLTANRPVTVYNGDAACEGIARGVDETGALQV